MSDVIAIVPLRILLRYARESGRDITPKLRRAAQTFVVEYFSHDTLVCLVRGEDGTDVCEWRGWVPTAGWTSRSGIMAGQPPHDHRAVPGRGLPALPLCPHGGGHVRVAGGQAVAERPPRTAAG